MDEPEILGRAESSRGEVLLRRVHRDGRSVVELRVNGVFVMDDVETTSERALAAESLVRCRSPRRVLVGGLGLGFTLAAVLRDPRVERVVVVEIEEAVVAWMRAGTVPHGPALLDDPRVEVVVADVGDVLSRADRAAYDLVLLDVDNGPSYLVHETNARLYRAGLLDTAHRALAPGGLAVVWSMTREPALLAALRDVFGESEAVPYAVSLGGGSGVGGAPTRDEQYWLHIAERAPSSRERAESSREGAES